MFELKTSQGCVNGVVGVEENFRKMVYMIVGSQSLTLKCIVRVFSLKSSLKRTPSNFMGNVGLYNVGKGMRKSTLKKFRQ